MAFPAVNSGICGGRSTSVVGYAISFLLWVTMITNNNLVFCSDSPDVLNPHLKSEIRYNGNFLQNCSEVVSCATPEYEIECADQYMAVTVKNFNANTTDVYLESLKFYPDDACKGKVMDDGTAATDDNTVSSGGGVGRLLVFNVTFENVHRCGLTRVINNVNGVRMYYHHLMFEDKRNNNRQKILVKCSGAIKNHLLYRRSIATASLPDGFAEQENVEITGVVEKNAPSPMLQVAIRQGSQLIDGELNVKPGTPLTMEITLDEKSSPIYGILVNYMHITDTKFQDETIVFNGCSVDAYLFENFKTIDGDILTAKFRAFKFPDTTYVQFVGTVNVCLDRCSAVTCDGGNVGYGKRRRRSVRVKGLKNNDDPKKIFEVTLTAFIKVGDK